jgi:hypothetical protein
LSAATIIFVAAAIVFAIEPMAAKALQPSLGGVPAVWTTCLLFFQIALLVGYFAQYLLVRTKRPLAQWGLHAAIFLVPLALSRFDFAAALRTTASTRNPVLASLGFLLSTVGLPFVALCTVAPSMQRYFARLTTREPYALYAASNAGSAVGLLLYPFAIEPWLPLATQSSWLRISYILVVGAVLIYAAAALRREKLEPSATATLTSDSHGQVVDRGAEDLSVRSEPIGQLVRWGVLAAIPSGLLATTSSTLAGDLPGIPLLWITPLWVYLATFVVAFARPRAPTPMADRVAVLLAIVLVPVTLRRTTSPYLLLLVLHLSFLAAVSFGAHARLAALAPPASRLERYFLVVSLGGVIGTLVFAIIPPFVFSDLWECPLTIAVTALVPLVGLQTARPPVPRRTEWLLAFGAGVWLLVAAVITRLCRASPLGMALAAAYVPPVLLCARSARSPKLLAIALLSTAFCGAIFERSSALTVAYGRSFFGTTRVQAPRDLGLHVLVHGTTIHGAERLSRRGQCEARSYYRVDGPVGKLFAARRAHFRDQSIFAIGLGAGALVCYARPQERWTFVEIDPDVVRVARDPALFSFLQHNPLPQQQLRVVLGDGRLVLNEQPTSSIDVVIVDAFNSDSVPLHLLTREAFERYFTALKTNGWLVLHISNHALDLPRVVSAIVRANGLAARVNEDAAEFSGRGSAPTWAIIARTEQELATALPLSAGWMPLPEPEGLPAFRDDYASLWRAVRRRW